MVDASPIKINEWTIYAHRLFIEQVNALIEEVEELRHRFPEDYKRKNACKRLAAIRKLAFEVIPNDPTMKEYRQGNTLGKKNQHWFRAKFFQQYRLFFRYHSKMKIIVYGWVNDESTKREYGGKTDAYKIFGKMLENGCPPNNWNDLFKEAEINVTALSNIQSQAD